MKLIAISAKKRHGKDTAADYICSTGRYKKYALASPFKEKIAEYFGFSMDEVNGFGYDREQYIDGLTGEVVAIKFAQIIKDFGYSQEVIESVNWSDVENCDQWSIRTLMQTLGTDIGCDQVDKMIWMHPMVKLRNEMINEGNWDGLIISDCRQDHEMQVMRECDAIVIHINNPFIKNNDTHITEAGLPVMRKDPCLTNMFDPSKSDDDEYCRQSMEFFTHQLDSVLGLK